MSRGKFLAHSPRRNVPAQSYATHITEVHSCAVKCARQAVEYYSGNRAGFIDWIAAAALYHDLGKLDPQNQEVLSHSTRDHLKIAHEDAGVAELDRLERKESSVLVAAHHAGLFSRDAEMAKQGHPFRRIEIFDHVDKHLDEYLSSHRAAGLPVLEPIKPTSLQTCGFTRRVALSCLVNADYGDTARHYGGEVEAKVTALRWNERAKALDRYVHNLAQGKTKREQLRNELRRCVYTVCQAAPIMPAIRACNAPVGTGKTTAVMAHLLRVAAEKIPPLRHIIVVLPYTSIITQAVRVYREALVLEGERPEEVVAEHHHRADFQDLDLRQFSTLWKAPIIVTTAVQFFETLGSHLPARLRKLHELPGSAVFVDETHAALPSHLWPQMWQWLETWTREWGGHLVLASGSLPRFWELVEFSNLIMGNLNRPIFDVPDLIGEDLRSKLHGAEQQRLCYCRRSEEANALDCNELIKFVTNKPGPRLLIVNTVQTAAVIAKEMREQGHNVLHLSTALAPVHRELIVERIKYRLRDKIEDWTLVATSCVEAGMNFSFRTGFRERGSTSSLIQVGGRVSRGDEHQDAVVWDLLLRDDCFRQNPAIKVARNVLDQFSNEELNRVDPSSLATSAMKCELTLDSEERAKTLVEAEKAMEYPKVDNLCRVINTDTRTVVIDKALAETIRRGQKVSSHELLAYSVQIWVNKVVNLALDPLTTHGRNDESALYEWGCEYDPDFLGYMSGVLRNQEFLNAGGAII